MTNLPQSPDFEQNFDGGNSDFRISSQSFINEPFYNSRTSDHIDMKIEPVIKLDKKNTATSKKFEDYVISVNCNVIVFFLIYAQFAAIRKPDSGRIVYKIYIFNNKKLLSYKN